MSRKGRYHHVKFDEDDEFETPAFAFLNDNKGQGVSQQVVDSDEDVVLEDSENEDSDDNVLSTDDDDDAPEDVSFQTGKQTALQQMRDAIKHINEEKIRVKEKRRKIDQQFKEQKKRKMEEMKNVRLSDDFLEELGDKAKKTKTTEKKHVKSDVIERSSLQDDEDEGSFADTEDDLDQNQDFIPFETDRCGGVDVQTIKQYRKKTVSMTLTAAEFKYRRLYGSNIQRESTRSKMAKIAKRKANR